MDFVVRIITDYYVTFTVTVRLQWLSFRRFPTRIEVGIECFHSYHIKKDKSVIVVIGGYDVINSSPFTSPIETLFGIFLPRKESHSFCKVSLSVTDHDGQNHSFQFCLQCSPAKFMIARSGLHLR